MQITCLSFLLLIKTLKELCKGCLGILIYFVSSAEKQTHSTSTMLWFSKKQRWRNGPKLPKTIYNRFCSTSINSTSAIFVFVNSEDYRNEFFNHVAIFDFEKNLWHSVNGIKLDASRKCAIRDL